MFRLLLLWYSFVSKLLYGCLSMQKCCGGKTFQNSIPQKAQKLLENHQKIMAINSFHSFCFSCLYVEMVTFLLSQLFIDGLR